MGVVQLVFLLLALLIVIAGLWPNWNVSAGPAVAVNRLIGIVVGLIVLFILYLIVVALFGGGSLTVHA